MGELTKYTCRLNNHRWGVGAHCNKEQAGPATTGGPAVRTRYCPLMLFGSFRGRVSQLSFEFWLAAIFLQTLVPMFIYVNVENETQTSGCKKITT